MAPKTTRHASSRSTAQLGIGALMLGFVFLSWCVLVGGLSAVQHRGVQASSVSYRICLLILLRLSSESDTEATTCCRSQ